MPKLEQEIDDILEPVLATFRARLNGALLGHGVTGYLQGSAQMQEFGRTLVTDRPIYFEGPPMRQAINYANRHCAQLVTRMDAETKDRLARVVGDAIENKRGIDGLARDIRREFDDMSRYRSKLIARTETADALSQGSMDRMDAMGVTGKEWVTFHPCEICEENELAGAIPMNEEFPSGHMRPPAHPSCRCALAPVMLKTEKSF